MQHPILLCVVLSLLWALSASQVFVPTPCLEHTVLPWFITFFHKIWLCQENPLELPYALERKCSPRWHTWTSNRSPQPSHGLGPVSLAASWVRPNAKMALANVWAEMRWTSSSPTKTKPWCWKLKTFWPTIGTSCLQWQMARAMGQKGFPLWAGAWSGLPCTWPKRKARAGIPQCSRTWLKFLPNSKRRCPISQVAQPCPPTLQPLPMKSQHWSQSHWRTGSMIQTNSCIFLHLQYKDFSKHTTHALVQHI